MDSLQDTLPPSHGGCCPAFSRLVPRGFGAEAWTLFALSGPLFLFQMLTFMNYVVSTVFCGHLGKAELASVTLAVAFVNVCGVSVGVGLSSACDTLMSQSFGSPNKKHVGVILQRGTLVLLLCCFPCWALFLNTQHILLLFRQDPEVSRLTQDYVMIFIPGLPVIFLYNLLAKYLQNQKITWPQVLSGVVGNCVNGMGNYTLVSVLGLGIRGSAYANIISQFAQTVFLLLYIMLKKLHLETWAGWSSQCLQDWGPFFSLAVPSMLMICIEWWAYEIGSFLMGLLSVEDLSAQAVIYEVATVTYMIPLGLSIGVCVRVGMALGAADTVQAKRSAVSGVLLIVGISLVLGTLIGILKNQLGHIFTNDEDVIALVGQVLPVYSVFHLFEAVCCVYGGVLRGTGKQAFGAAVNAITYYVIGLPLGILLTFVVRMRIMGLWLGMLACVSLATAAFVVYTARLDWKLAAEEAKKHSGQQQQQRAESTATRPGPEKAVLSSVATGSSPGITLTTYSRSECHVDLFRTPEEAHTLSDPTSRLSVKQLVIRRGAALGAASATLLVGLAVRILTTKH
ncbi:multidrug and toxin extrusion protein 2 isoform X2 [Saimiri boliviensis]|uniref:Multidrug and toxin extrusion protein n=1 Tax=Saimiri boliviensis boliviensis TaxID=39432 RepID=A0A2K6SYZ0_SAIBB|nr:multidrug and toxin extrusion protein 2 isoform X4 [Saimiri boliviensis boliviensis]